MNVKLNSKTLLAAKMILYQYKNKTWRKKSRQAMEIHHDYIKIATGNKAKQTKSESKVLVTNN